MKQLRLSDAFFPFIYTPLKGYMRGRVTEAAINDTNHDMKPVNTLTLAVAGSFEEVEALTAELRSLGYQPVGWSYDPNAPLPCTVTFRSKHHQRLDLACCNVATRASQWRCRSEPPRRSKNLLEGRSRATIGQRLG